MERSLTKSRRNCSVVGCTNTHRNCPPGTKFFVFPNNRQHAIRRKAWIAAIKRDTPDGKPWNPTANSRICSRHFISGQSTRDPDSPGYIPRLYMKPNSSDQQQKRTLAMCSGLPNGYVYTSFSEKKTTQQKEFYCYTLRTEEEMKEWVKKFGENTEIEWRIARTFPHLQRIKCSYKIAYRCQHSKSSHSLKSSSNRETKSTNCPAQLIIKRIGEKERETTLIMLKNEHNHIFRETTTSLKYQDVNTKAQNEEDIVLKKMHGEAFPHNPHLVLVNETASSVHEMDTKIQIKKEDPLSDVASQNERGFFPKHAAIKPDNDAMLVDRASDNAIKTEVKSEPPDFSVQEEAELFTKHINQIHGSNNYDIDMQTEIKDEVITSNFDSHCKEFLSVEPLMKVEGITMYGNGNEMDGNVEVKGEPCSLEMGT